MMRPVEKAKQPTKTNNTLKQPIQNPSNDSRRKEQVASVDYFERRLDDKRRLTIPAELRAEFISGVVLTRGFGNYLHLYPKAIWDGEVELALNAGSSILDEKTADVNVQFRRGKTEAELDQKQGRITIEQHLLEYAGIDREIVAIRAGKYWRLITP